MAEAIEPITGIGVRGFKSIASEQFVEIRPLTILAGANSSGKSSIMQPLLLLKQTLEAPYDPGPLKLDGPNVWFTSREQLFSKCGGEAPGSFSVAVHQNHQVAFSLSFRAADASLEIESMETPRGGHRISMNPDAPIIVAGRPFGSAEARADLGEPGTVAVQRDRCFLVLQLRPENAASDQKGLNISFVFRELQRAIQQVVHVPGLRGNPERTYKYTPISDRFPGTFEHYVGSVIGYWQRMRATRCLMALGAQMLHLGLTWTVQAEQIDDTRVSVLVGRLQTGSPEHARQLVSIADVGFGISQVLPVLVALLVASRDQIVYIEQPELHLHPRAQFELASVLADAAKRGVRVVAETHSATLIRGIQTLVARGELAPDLVKLHWFARDPEGCTQVHSADLDEDGAFGDWPEDFDEFALEVENEYLNATEARRARK